MHDHRTDARTKHPGVIKRGNRYQVRYRDRHGKSDRRSAPTLAAALDLQAKLRTGQVSQTAAPIFSDYADEWMRTYRGRSGTARDQTLVEYRRTIKSAVLPYFARMRLDRIEAADVRDWVRQTAGRGCSRGTCRVYLTALRLLLDTAVEDGILQRNPAQGVRVAYVAPGAAETTDAARPRRRRVRPTRCRVPRTLAPPAAPARRDGRADLGGARVGVGRHRSRPAPRPCPPPLLQGQDRPAEDEDEPPRDPDLHHSRPPPVRRP